MRLGVVAGELLEVPLGHRQVAVVGAVCRCRTGGGTAPAPVGVSFAAEVPDPAPLREPEHGGGGVNLLDRAGQSDGLGDELLRRLWPWLDVGVGLAPQGRLVAELIDSHAALGGWAELLYQRLHPT